MTDTANGTRVSVHDLHGDELAAYIADHKARWGVPPLAGAQDPPDGEPEGGKPDGDGGKDWQAEAEKWKALARKHEAGSKAGKSAAEKLAEIEEAQKTEAEKAADKLSAETARADKAQAQLDRLEVALEKAPEGMKLAQVRKLARRLTGDTREEMEQDATELFADFKPSGSTPDTGGGGADDPDGGDDKGGKEPSGGRRPTEALKPGAAPNADPDDADTDPDKLAAKVPRMY